MMHLLPSEFLLFVSSFLLCIRTITRNPLLTCDGRQTSCPFGLITITLFLLKRIPLDGNWNKAQNVICVIQRTPFNKLTKGLLSHFSIPLCENHKGKKPMMSWVLIIILEMIWRINFPVAMLYPFLCSDLYGCKNHLMAEHSQTTNYSNHSSRGT